jgi:nucleotide-binding universal stress UspA family protein
LVHVEPPPLVSGSVPEEGHRWHKNYRRAAVEGLSSLAKRIRRIYQACQAVCLVGEPAEQVAWLAQLLKADLFITARNHPSYLGRLFRLSQAPKILHLAPCPVLVYHEKRQASLA